MSDREEVPRCQASSQFEECGKKAKYKIKDIVCSPTIYDDGFYICESCKGSFIKKGKKEPHYKLIKILK